jgi:hypothetical protein
MDKNKCPFFKTWGVLLKQDFPKKHFRPLCSNLRKNAEKSVTVVFLLFIRKRI